MFHLISSPDAKVGVAYVKGTCSILVGEWTSPSSLDNPKTLTVPSPIVHVHVTEDHYLLVIDETKRLSVFFRESNNDPKLLSSRILPRQVACLSSSFDHKCAVVGTNTGEVWLVAYPDVDTRVPVPALAHTTSMITSLALTPDFLVTADRDEKIRVSHFPNTNIIETYCLGHVSPIVEIQALTDTVLASVDQSGIFKVWHVPSGQSLPLILNSREPVSELENMSHFDTHRGSVVMLTKSGTIEIYLANVVEAGVTLTLKESKVLERIPGQIQARDDGVFLSYATAPWLEVIIVATTDDARDYATLLSTCRGFAQSHSPAIVVDAPGDEPTHAAEEGKKRKIRSPEALDD